MASELSQTSHENRQIMSPPTPAQSFAKDQPEEKNGQQVRWIDAKKAASEKSFKAVLARALIT